MRNLGYIIMGRSTTEDPCGDGNHQTMSVFGLLPFSQAKKLLIDERVGACLIAGQKFGLHGQMLLRSFILRQYFGKPMIW